MLDEEQTALNEQGEENIPEESPTTEQISEEVPQTEAEEASDTLTGDTETDERPKKGYQSRVRELVRERNEAREQAKSLSERLAEISGSNEPQGFPTYVPQSQDEPLVKPGEELTAEDLNRRIQEREQRIIQTISAQNELRQRQSEAIQRINNEAQTAIKAHPELDPDSEVFDKDLSDTVTEAVEAHVRANPYSASVKKFVDKLMKPYKGAVDREVGKASENIARQVSQAALRPSSVRKPEKGASELSLAELEAKLGIVNS